MARILEIVVAPNGEMTVQTRGYSGGECIAASRFLEQELGVMLREQKTAEYFHVVNPATQELQQ